MENNSAPIIISLGGSLIAPDEIDTAFLSAFVGLIKECAAAGSRFVIICGGGKTARRYQAAAKDVRDCTREELDWIGIHATRLNAELVRTMFGRLSYANIITDPQTEIADDFSVLIGAGYEPGCSTDADAVLMAKKFGATTIINLSNVDYVYDRDPRTNSDARQIKQISWHDFMARFGDKWNPGLHSPFDPIASKEAARLGLRVIVTNGADLPNLRAIIEGKTAKGTIIS